MNLLILIDTLSFGGAEKQAVNDANLLSKKGISVIFAYFNAGPLTIELLPLVKKIYISERSYLLRIKAVARIIKDSKCDIVHAHMFKAELVAGAACKLANVGLIFNEHGLGLWKRAYHRLAFRAAASCASEVLCASDACRCLRRNLEGIPNRKLKTVYNSFMPFQEESNDTEKSPLRRMIISSLEMTDKGLAIIGYVGRFDAVKQLSLFAVIAERLEEQNVAFVIVGDGKERNCFENLIREKGLENQFYLPGFVHQPKQYYDLFDIFVLPSKRESLSVSLLEAGGCGVPAVAFDVGGNSEVISHGETGFIIPENDLEGLVDKVRKLVSDKELRQRLGKEAMRRISDKFSEERRLSQLISIYECAAIKQHENY